MNSDQVMYYFKYEVVEKTINQIEQVIEPTEIEIYINQQAKLLCHTKGANFLKKSTFVYRNFKNNDLKMFLHWNDLKGKINDFASNKNEFLNYSIPLKLEHSDTSTVRVNDFYCSIFQIIANENKIGKVFLTKHFEIDKDLFYWEEKGMPVKYELYMPQKEDTLIYELKEFTTKTINIRNMFSRYDERTFNEFFSKIDTRIIKIELNLLYDFGFIFKLF